MLLYWNIFVELHILSKNNFEKYWFHRFCINTVIFWKCFKTGSLLSLYSECTRTFLIWFSSQLPPILSQWFPFLGLNKDWSRTFLGLQGSESLPFKFTYIEFCVNSSSQLNEVLSKACSPAVPRPPPTRHTFSLIVPSSHRSFYFQIMNESDVVFITLPFSVWSEVPAQTGRFYNG